MEVKVEKILNIDPDYIVERVVKPIGDGAHVTVNKELIGEEVYVCKKLKIVKSSQ